MWESWMVDGEISVMMMAMISDGAVLVWEILLLQSSVMVPENL
jgi:hypothetical protein